MPKIHKHRNRKTRKILKKFSLVMLRGRFVWFGVCVWLCLLVLRMNQYWGVGARAPRAGRRQQNRRNMTGRTFFTTCVYVDFFILFVGVCVRWLLFFVVVLCVRGLSDCSVSALLIDSYPSSNRVFASVVSSSNISRARYSPRKGQ